MSWRKCVFLSTVFLLFLMGAGEANAYRSPFSGGQAVKSDRSSSRGALKAFEEVQRLYLAADIHGTLSRGNAFLDRYHRSRYTDDVLHLLALTYLSQGKPSHARHALHKIKLNYPRSDLNDQVDLALGDTYARLGVRKKAIRIWSRALTEYPRTPYGALYHERLATAYQREGQFNLARRHFETLVNSYPNSLESHKAHKVLSENELYFTIQVGSFSKRQNADKLLGGLRERGMQPYLSQRANGSRTYYRVRVGRFDSRKEAELLASRLRKKGYLTKIYP